MCGHSAIADPESVIQLRLIVGTDFYDWRDFCAYTCRGVSVEGIFQDEAWQ